jgi:hypothetical protein
VTTHVDVPADRWHCAQYTDSVSTVRLTTGQIVVADRRPFRIDRVTEIPTDQWPDRFVTQWRERGMPDPDQWQQRPVKVTGVFEGPAASDKLHQTIGPASHIWDVLPEHYMVCNRCLELPPCRHVHNERIAARATESMEEAMAILPGACHGCREPITSRQKSFTFPGPNLVRPDLGDDSAIFHTRGACLGSLRSYDKRWAAAEPDRRRLFYCEGTRTWHYDGTPECTRQDCTGKGSMARLVDHRASVWHHPGTPERHYDVMRDFGYEPGANNSACWCIEGEATT